MSMRSHDPVGVLELVDRVLQLPVQHHPVGDHHDLVEHLACRSSCRFDSRCASQAIVFDLPDPAECCTRYVVPGPSSRAAASRPQHGVPLVEPREDHRRRAAFDPFAGFSTCTNRASRSSQASRCHTRSHRYAVRCPSGFGGLPAPPVVALVERQEPGVPARPAGSSSPPARCRPRSAPPPARQRPVRRVPVGAVLRDRVLDALAGQRVLQLRRRHRDAVDEQRQVERLASSRS